MTFIWNYLIILLPNAFEKVSVIEMLWACISKMLEFKSQLVILHHKTNHKKYFFRSVYIHSTVLITYFKNSVCSRYTISCKPINYATNFLLTDNFSTAIAPVLATIPEHKISKCPRNDICYANIIGIHSPTKKCISNAQIHALQNYAKLISTCHLSVVYIM
jgi:hypothetical protein